MRIAFSNLRMTLYISRYRIAGSQERSITVNCNHSHCMAVLGRPWFFSLFLAVSIGLTFAIVGGVKPKQDLPALAQKAASAGHPPTLLFMLRGTVSNWEVSSCLWAVSARGMGWCRQSEVVFLIFFCNYSHCILFHCVA